ncbi:hypothetical protein [Xanthomonas melonis]|uniref:hypothetical protein n=1 Tax=Xanthomonas melonis TaxID=56456 RepID=UPI0011B048D0|nr:hypothetical protein [Xanthomonas melonis]MCC4601917.1 hypothetical protein [Xanthomonas melonis]
MQHPYDFFRLEGPVPVYAVIESRLSEIGLWAEAQPNFLQQVLGIKPVPNNPWAGFAYKNQVLRAAGWDVDKDGSYTNNPDKAAEVFIKIGHVLSESKDPEEILRLVGR